MIARIIETVYIFVVVLFAWALCVIIIYGVVHQLNKRYGLYSPHDIAKHIFDRTIVIWVDRVFYKILDLLFREKSC